MAVTEADSGLDSGKNSRVNEVAEYKPVSSKTHAKGSSL